MKLDDLIRTGIQTSATDVHIQADAPPTFRVAGQMMQASCPPLEQQAVENLIGEMLPPEMMQKANDVPVVEYVHTFDGVRCRASVYHQRGTLAMVVRLLASQDLSFEALHLPKALERVAAAARGLALVVGPGGSGRSTTVAALVDHINTTSPRKVVAIEDLIEYDHPNKKGMVSQIQLGRDADDANEALRYAIHQDPDVIVLPELVTPADILAAMTAAQTGKLVISTFLSGMVTETLERIRGMFPLNEWDVVMGQMAGNLRAICCMRLMRGKDRKTMYPATELLTTSPGVVRMIMDGDFPKLEQIMESESGMHRFDESIMASWKAGFITDKEGARLASSPEKFEMAARQQAEAGKE